MEWSPIQHIQPRRDSYSGKPRLDSPRVVTSPKRAPATFLTDRADRLGARWRPGGGWHNGRVDRTAVAIAAWFCRSSLGRHGRRSLWLRDVALRPAKKRDQPQLTTHGDYSQRQTPRELDVGAEQQNQGRDEQFFSCHVTADSAEQSAPTRAALGRKHRGFISKP